jgi:ABC-type multidrug transport system ATPase subunit
MTNAIEIQRLCYRAGRTFEIKDLDLHVPDGAIYGFLGPSSVVPRNRSIQARRANP